MENVDFLEIRLKKIPMARCKRMECKKKDEFFPKFLCLFKQTHFCVLANTLLCFSKHTFVFLQTHNMVFWISKKKFDSKKMAQFWYFWISKNLVSKKKWDQNA